MRSLVISKAVQNKFDHSGGRFSPAQRSSSSIPGRLKARGEPPDDRSSTVAAASTSHRPDEAPPAMPNFFICLRRGPAGGGRAADASLILYATFRRDHRHPDRTAVAGGTGARRATEPLCLHAEETGLYCGLGSMVPYGRYKNGDCPSMVCWLAPRICRISTNFLSPISLSSARASPLTPDYSFQPGLPEGADLRCPTVSFIYGSPHAAEKGHKQVTAYCPTVRPDQWRWFRLQLSPVGRNLSSSIGPGAPSVPDGRAGSSITIASVDADGTDRRITVPEGQLPPECWHCSTLMTACRDRRRSRYPACLAQVTAPRS